MAITRDLEEKTKDLSDDEVRDVAKDRGLLELTDPKVRQVAWIAIVTFIAVIGAACLYMYFIRSDDPGKPDTAFFQSAFTLCLGAIIGLIVPQGSK